MKTTTGGVRLRALRAVFPYTLPICAAFLFLGATYGVYMNATGFSFVYPMIMSAVIFGGSLEFLCVSMLLSHFAPLQTLLAAIMIQARHLFYGISMLKKFEGMGWKKPYLIFGMCDETFSINYSVKVPDNIDRGWFMLFVTLLNQIYWVTGATLGGLLGSLLKFDLAGIEFVMTAMFTVIFLEQWLKERRRAPALIGFAAAIACRAIFGTASFLVPSMAVILICLAVFRKPIEQEPAVKKESGGGKGAAE